MPAARKQTTKRTYRGPAVQGNLALSEARRRLEDTGRMDFDQVYRRAPDTRSDRIARERREARAALRPAQHVSAATVCASAAVSVLVVVLLVCYAQLNAVSVHVVAMKSEIDALEVERVRLLTEYERDFDLASVNEKARADGMDLPGESQIYYIDLPGQDQAVSCAGQDEGTLDRFAERLRQSVDTAVAYFR